jgi:hypothetical protein
MIMRIEDDDDEVSTLCLLLKLTLASQRAGALAGIGCFGCRWCKW